MQIYLELEDRFAHSSFIVTLANTLIPWGLERAEAALVGDTYPKEHLDARKKEKHSQKGRVESHQYHHTRY